MRFKKLEVFVSYIIPENGKVFSSQYEFSVFLYERRNLSYVESLLLSQSSLLICIYFLLRETESKLGCNATSKRSFYLIQS